MINCQINDLKWQLVYKFDILKMIVFNWFCLCIYVFIYDTQFFPLE